MFIYVYFDVSYANQDCIYLIKNKKKLYFCVILWIIIANIIYSSFKLH